MQRSDETLREIRETAYYKWEEAGRGVGDGVTFWLEAEKEVLERHAGESELVDIASEQSFPASDPPAWTGVTAS